MNEWQSPAQEWYAEEVYDCSPPLKPALYDPDLKVGDPYFNVNGDLLGIVTSINHETKEISVITQGRFNSLSKVVLQAGRRYGKALRQAFKPFAVAIQKTQADFVLFPPPLKFNPKIPTKPPHCMAPRPGARLYGPGGRKRY